MKIRKKLIEVALPLEAINTAAAREKSIRHGHPSTLHLWWARRPLAAARAVIFAQMVDDPSAWPDLFPTEKAQEKERKRLFKIIEDLVRWENTTNERVLEPARNEIWQSWRRTCGDNADHPYAKDLFDRSSLPAFHDPFAGGGALPLEAQRLGLESYASDLNPVAVLINKAMIEIPPMFAGIPPMNPEWQALPEAQKQLKSWTGSQGLAEDVRYYGKWIRAEAEKRIGHLYPKIEITAEMATDRPDLKPYVGRKLTVIAWLWARTVKSPSPAFADVDVPLASTFLLSNKSGKVAYVKPTIEDDNYRLVVKLGGLKDKDAAENGTKLGRGSNFRCVMSGDPISGDYIKREGQAGRMGMRLMAIVAEGQRERIYLSPDEFHSDVALSAVPDWKPDVTISGSTQYIGVRPYGMEKFSDLFSSRQLKMLGELASLVASIRETVRQKVEENVPNGKSPDVFPRMYSDAISTYLGEVLSKLTAYHCTLGVWRAAEGKTGRTFGRQALQMVWDFPECNPFAGAGGDWLGACNDSAKVLADLGSGPPGHARQAIAQSSKDWFTCPVVSTDPPYYDNVPYADLSDFYYVWLRFALKGSNPELFSTVAVPKSEELVAFAYRHKNKELAAEFFMDGMTTAMSHLAMKSHPSFPVTIYYAFRQSETDDSDGVASTGWETFLDAVIKAGFSVSGTWPMRTELGGALKSLRNALASSIVLVCRKRPEDAPVATRREFVQALELELAPALRNLQEGNIAPVDLAQAAIGPGMGVYTRYSQVLDAEGKPLTVKHALALINEKLDTVLAEQEGDFDADTRWALAWFDQVGFAEGEYGLAETLSKAKNTSVNGMVEAGILVTKAGKVRLLKPEELPDDWDPQSDARLTEWEVVHQLIRALNSGGESGAARLVLKLGNHADIARELAYRLYVLCERKKRAQDALAYNALVQSWPEIQRLANEQQQTEAPAQQSTMFS